MAIIIRQGVQDTSKDKSFEKIIENNALVQITKIEINEKRQGSIKITMKVLAGANKGRLVWDNVDFDPSSSMSWKYRKLRKAAGVPYVEGEPTAIDIEKLLLNKAMRVDLGIRKDKNDTNKTYQDVAYRDQIDNTEKTTTRELNGVTFEEVGDTSALELLGITGTSLNDIEDEDAELWE